MEREIKFRGFDKIKNRMLNNIQRLSLYADLIDIICDESIIESAHRNFTFSKENIVLMQFTGLKDKNGKEIYEGDIIRRSLSGATPTTTDKVYFHNGNFVIGVDDYIKPLSDFCTLEVIGNIHQNPELLK